MPYDNVGVRPVQGYNSFDIWCRKDLLHLVPHNVPLLLSILHHLLPLPHSTPEFSEEDSHDHASRAFICILPPCHRIFHLLSLQLMDDACPAGYVGARAYPP